MTSEADIRENKVVPKLEESNWNKNQLEREFPIKSKRYYVNGEEYLEVEPPKKFADLLLKVNNLIVGVVEVKKDTKNAEEGIAQAKDYAQRLDVPISFATNGSTILMYDRRTLQVTEVESYLTPEELFTIYKEFKQLPETISFRGNKDKWVDLQYVAKKEGNKNVWLVLEPLVDDYLKKHQNGVSKK